MAQLSLCEKINGDIELSLRHEQTMSFKLDKQNCIEIEIFDEYGDSTCVEIPKKHWSEFIRLCQKLKLS